MIVKVHKYLIIGTQAEVDRFFPLAQRAGFIEFIGPSAKRSHETPPEAQKLLASLKILRQYVSEDEGEALPVSPESVLQLHSDLERMREEERLLLVEISRVAPFGDFSMDDIRFIDKVGKRILQFFCMKSDEARDLVLPSEVVYIGTEYDLDYFVSINVHRTDYPKMIEIEIPQPLGSLQRQLNDLRVQIARCERRLRMQARSLHELEERCAERLSDHHLQLAKSDVSFPLGEEEPFFSIEAWVPETRIDSLMALTSKLNVYCEEVACEERDVIPTCMENRGVGKIGEDLTLLYDTPSHIDRDPSVWVLVFFALFFAMIVCDGAYGAIFLGLSLWARYKGPKHGVKRRVANLACIASATCVAWGIVTASFFGVEIEPGSPVSRASLLHTLAIKIADYHLVHKDDVYTYYVERYPAVQSATDGVTFLQKAHNGTEYVALDQFSYQILLEWSLLAGIIHLALGFLRYLRFNYAGLGWVCVLIGGYLFCPSVIQAQALVNYLGWLTPDQSRNLGVLFLEVGLGLVLVFSFLQKRWFELLHIPQIFGDVLSYIRLYALALASILIAKTFNSMAAGAGFLGGLIIILLAHSTNIGLAVIGGVVHSLRLNFLEWYHYSFLGEGTLFNPLKKTKLE